MLTYIESDRKKSAKNKNQKTKIFLDFEKETSKILNLHHSQTSLNSRASPKHHLKLNSERKLKGLSKLEANHDKTEKLLERYTMPELSRAKRKRFSIDVYAQKYVPSSVNEQLIQRFRGLSIMSMNCLNTHNKLLINK